VRPTEVRTKLPILAALGLLLAGCATTTGPTPAGTASGVPVPSTGLVFRIADTPGLMPPGGSMTVPRWALYGDGLLVQPGSTATAPVTRQLTPAGVRRVVQGAIDAGLAAGTDYGTPRVMDAGTTRFTVVTSQPYRTDVVQPDSDDVTPAQRQARQRLRAFLDRLVDLDGWLGADIAPGTRPYRYTSVAVYAIPHEPDPASTAPVWPLDDLGTAGTAYNSARCQVVAAANLTGVPSGPVYRSGAALYYVVLRPLLPDEKSCADLGPGS
jgi:hypothetical protein